MCAALLGLMLVCSTMIFPVTSSHCSASPASARQRYALAHGSELEDSALQRDLEVQQKRAPQKGVEPNLVSVFTWGKLRLHALCARP